MSTFIIFIFFLSVHCSFSRCTYRIHIFHKFQFLNYLACCPIFLHFSKFSNYIFLFISQLLMGYVLCSFVFFSSASSSDPRLPFFCLCLSQTQIMCFQRPNLCEYFSVWLTVYISIIFSLFVVWAFFRFASSFHHISCIRALKKKRKRNENWSCSQL